LNEAETELRGFKYDREWMITDSDYEFISQREIESMTTIKVNIDSKYLLLESKNKSQLKVALNTKRSEIVKAKIWDDTCMAFDEGDEASSWLTEVLGRYKGKTLRMIRFDSEGKRPVPAKYLHGQQAESAFSDQFPYLITSWESLNKLNVGLLENNSKEVPMSRFRPNIVVKGIADIEKKTSADLVSKLGNYNFGLRKPCKRCKITTINQDTGEIAEPKEPLSTLTSLEFSNENRGAFFGQNAILLSKKNCILRVGDELTIN
jgi:hypothetical protein